MARMHLIIAARRQVIDRRILPSMGEHDVTLTDRFWPCTVAYQGFGEEQNLDAVRQAAIRGVGEALPRRIFVVDVPGALAVERMVARGGPMQIFDDRAAAYHEQVRQGYLSMAQEESGLFTVGDGTQPEHRVARMMARVILQDLASSGG